MSHFIIFIIVVMLTAAYYKLIIPIAALYLGIIFDNVLYGLIGMVVTWLFLMVISKVPD